MKPELKSALTILLAGFAIGADASGPVTLLDNGAAGVAAFCAVTTDVPWAQGFTMPKNGITYEVTGVTACNLTTVWNYGSPPARVTLWSSVGGARGVELGVVGSQPVTQDGNLAISSAAGLFLSPGASYFIQFEAPGSMWEMSAAPVGPNTGLATFGQFLEYGTTPLAFTASMILSAVPVPEPTTFWLLIAALAAAVGVRTGKLH